MALKLIATPGAADSNSYCTMEEAEAYIESRLHSDAWATASDSDKVAALVWSTRLLDQQVEWYGSPTKPDVQKLSHPRAGLINRVGMSIDSTIIADFLKEATAELALILISEDTTGNYALAGFDKIKVDVIELVADSKTAPHAIPESVRAMVDFYGQVRFVGDQKQVVR